MLNRLRCFFRFFLYLFKYNISVWDFFSIIRESRISSRAKLSEPYHIGNSTIDDYSYVAKNSNISFTQIGKYCSIGPNILCGWGIHPINGISTSPMFYSNQKQNGYSMCNCAKIEEREPIYIGNDVFIGSNVTILDGVTIGDGAVIGAGAVVSKDIPPYAVAVGCPIKVIKYRFPQNIIDSLLKIEWWNRGDDIHHDISNLYFNIEEFIDKYE